MVLPQIPRQLNVLQARSKKITSQTFSDRLAYPCQVAALLVNRTHPAKPTRRSYLPEPFHTPRNHTKPLHANIPFQEHLLLPQFCLLPQIFVAVWTYSPASQLRIIRLALNLRKSMSWRKKSVREMYLSLTRKSSTLKAMDSADWELRITLTRFTAFSVGVSQTPSDPSAQSGYEHSKLKLETLQLGNDLAFHNPQHWTGCLILCAYLILFLFHDWLHMFCAGQSDSGYEWRYR